MRGIRKGLGAQLHRRQLARIDVGTPQSIHEYRGLLVRCVILAHCTYLIGGGNAATPVARPGPRLACLRGPEPSSAVDLALGSKTIGTKARGSSKYSSFYRRGITHDFISSDGRDNSIWGRRSLPAMVEFGRHYPSVGHAPKFREIVFSVSQNEHDFGVFLPYWITLDGSPSVGAPGQEKSWRPQRQTTLSGEKGSGVSPL
jgi:hypothetical protein